MKVEFPLTAKQVKDCHDFYRPDDSVGVYRWHGIDLVLSKETIEDIKKFEKELSEKQEGDK